MYPTLYAKSDALITFLSRSYIHFKSLPFFFMCIPQCMCACDHFSIDTLFNKCAQSLPSKLFICFLMSFFITRTHFHRNWSWLWTITLTLVWNFLYRSSKGSSESLNKILILFSVNCWKFHFASTSGPKWHPFRLSWLLFFVCFSFNKKVGTQCVQPQLSLFKVWNQFPLISKKFV